MPLIIPKTLPAFDALYEENVFVMHRERALAQHIRPLEILILNLMPTKIATPEGKNIRQRAAAE